NNYYSDAISFLRAFLGAALKDNDENLERSVITGILRASKEGIFSDLNNLDVYTILSSTFQNKFGFTQEEVKKLLKDQKLSDKMQDVTEWYDGYKFVDTLIYN